MQSRHLLPKAAYWLCSVPIGRTWCEGFSGEVIMSISFFHELRVTKERLLGIPCWNRSSCRVDCHINDWRGKVTLCHPVGAVNVCGKQESQPPSNQLCWHQGGPGCLLVTWHCQEAACWGCLSPICALTHNWCRDYNKYLPMFIQVNEIWRLGSIQKGAWYLVACWLRNEQGLRNAWLC